jgi:uncharacterized protein
MQARFGSTAILGLFVFLSSTAGLSHSQADNKPVVYGISRTIHSTVLNEERTVLIRLPDDYGSSQKKYPVLYKLDGSVNIFIRTSGAVDYLADMTDRAPDHIVVAIVNTDRMRDMSPEKGANKFVQFIGSELIPFIESNYRTSSCRILSGQSLSSIFALYAFLRQPALFDAYILSSFGLYNESVASLFQNELKQSRELDKIGKKYLFITNGKMDSYDNDGSVARRGAQFLDSLRQTAPAIVRVNYKVYDDEGHVPFATIYDGLKWIYSEQKASNSYLGQAPPGETAVVFAPGIVSKNDVHSRLAISPDGKEMCWTSLSALGPQGTARLLCVSRVDEQWTHPQAPVFATKGPAANPLFSPDGTRLFYISKEDEKNGWRMQYAERTPSGWSTAKSDGFLLNPTSSFTSSGEVYFSDSMAGKPWNTGIYRAGVSAAGSIHAAALDSTINSPYIDYSPFISPDGTYLMFASSRPSPEENMFLYISFKSEGGTWSSPQKMNDVLGFSGNARFPSISPDEKYLFFCGDDGNIYWVDISVIEKFRTRQVSADQ